MNCKHGWPLEVSPTAFNLKGYPLLRKERIADLSMNKHKESKGDGAKNRPTAVPTSALATDAFWQDRVFWLIFVLAAGLLFWNLSGRCLWQDEAETALLGKNILHFGLPYAWDGANLVSQEYGSEFGEDYLWRWSPWVQFYLAAGSMSLFGYTTSGSRLLFALLGLFTIALTYVLAETLFQSRRISRLSMLFLTLSVPFLLHARQVRWYTPAYVLTIGLLLTFVEINKGKKTSIAGFVACAVLLWHTNFHVALGVLLALTAAAPIYCSERRFLTRLGIAMAISGLLIAPTFFFFLSFHAGRHIEPMRWLHQLAEYSGEYFTFLLPMPIAAGAIYLIASKSSIFDLPDGWRRKIGFLMAVCLAHWTYLSLGPWHFFRYLTVLLPITSILSAVVISRLMMKSQCLGWASLGILLFTDILHQTPLGFVSEALIRWDNPAIPGTRSRTQLVAAVGPISFPILCFLSEIKDPIDDPEWIVAQYLNKHAKPDDVVLISFGDLPLKFYTNLKIAGGITGASLPEQPDWAFPRQHVMSNEPGMDGDVLRFMDQHLTRQKYDFVPMAGRDVVIGNCPEPLAHYFAVPADAPPILLLRKK
jgi:hypothetical protein